MYRTLMFIPALLLAGCALLAGQTPQSTVFAAESTYGAALKVAVVYESLPRCVDMGPVLCSDTEVVAVLRSAATTAKTALEHAENVVRTPGVPDDVALTAVVTATEAAKAFSTIANQYK